jgi:hypothetical protein
VIFVFVVEKDGHLVAHDLLLRCIEGCLVSARVMSDVDKKKPYNVLFGVSVPFTYVFRRDNKSPYEGVV